MIRILDLPHHKAREAVSSGAPVFVLVNPVEYHGPHLSLHNDRLISLGLAQDLFERLALPGGLPFLVMDDVEAGWDPTPGLGTRHFPYATVKQIVLEACRALAELGA